MVNPSNGTFSLPRQKVLTVIDHSLRFNRCPKPFTLISIAILRLILERGRGTLDQVEETVTPRLNVRAVLSVVGRPEALRCRIISLIKQGLEGLQHNLLIVLCF